MIVELIEPEALDLCKSFSLQTSIGEDQVHMLASIAISLKRLADAVQRAEEAALAEMPGRTYPTGGGVG